MISKHRNRLECFRRDSFSQFTPDPCVDGRCVRLIRTEAALYLTQVDSSAAAAAAAASLVNTRNGCHRAKAANTGCSTDHNLAFLMIQHLCAPGFPGCYTDQAAIKQTNGPIKSQWTESAIGRTLTTR
ncbi:hypothetical protein JOB18_029300 [Solea senegalensis]|uniref:Uncharacterized protein n=1 Tax=Solea senegalensis TaxID=28829 RepID=A0AAV6T8Y1_SOLSE|nr:hypothetical protein JOB18_029300 [Solea senegalensis]